jgi:hypothetical protein
MAEFTLHRLRAAIAGLRYPCRSWEILAWADYNGVDAEMRRALWALPDRQYPDLITVARAMADSSPWTSFTLPERRLPRAGG